MLPRFLSRESTVALALAGLLLWAPLPAGSVTPAAELLFRLAAFALLGLAVAAGEARWTRATLLPVAALAAVALLGLAQSLPWPAALAALASPGHARLYAEASELVEAAPAAFVPLSVDGAVSRSSAVSWLAAAALLAVAAVAGRRPRHRRWLLWALTATAVVQIGIGLLRLHAASPGGLGSVLLRPEGRLLGAYPNPNALCFLLEMALVAVAAWCWQAAAGGAPRRRGLGLLLPVGLWLVLFTGVVLTGSRAGLVAALAATAVQAAALPLTERSRRAAVAAALVVVVGLLALIGVGSRLEVRRWETVSLFEDNLRSRMLLVAPSLELWRRFPLTGTGLGTFQDAFPAVSPAEVKSIHWNRAHNDPLELLVTGGLLGLGLACLALLALLRPIWRVTRHGRRVEDRAAGLAALGALTAAGLHELFDFALVMPANSLALLVILGSAAAAGLSRSASTVPA